MYPFIRLLTTSLRAKFSPPIDVTASSDISFYCMPWDIDMFMEMNNGRVLTLYDLGRFDLTLRSGMSAVLKKNQWGIVVAGSTIRYRRRIRAFEKVTMKSQVAGVEGRWVYVQQSMWVNGEPCSSVLLRTAITSQGKAIDSSKIVSAMGLNEWPKRSSEWCDAWVASEDLRPWPPE